MTLNEDNNGISNASNIELRAYDSAGNLTDIVSLDNSTDKVIIGQFDASSAQDGIVFNVGAGYQHSLITASTFDINSSNNNIGFRVFKPGSGLAIDYDDAADTITLGSETTMQDNLDVEGYMAVGNGSSLGVTKTLVVDRDFSTTGAARQLDVLGVITATGGTGNQFGFDVSPGFVINSGNTHTQIASAQFAVPDITVTSGTVTNASTVFISNAPTEGTNNYALNVNNGDVRFGGLPTSSAGLTSGTLWNDSGTVKIAP